MMQPDPAKQRLREMLQKAAEGDESAWRELVDEYSPRVFSLIRAQCGNADLAEEITQSSFCTIAVKIGQYDELGKFEQWLFRIAMNRLRDEMRRRKRQAVPVEHETLAALIGAGKGDAAGARLDPALIQRLRDALAQLSESDQRIIYLRYSGELSFKQIAEMHDEPLGTVLARQHRALEKLRKLMGRLEKGPEGP